MDASALYAGTLSHQRLAPRRHRLRYAMFQMLLDLDEAPALARRLRLFSCNRFNLFSHHDRDHGEGRPGALRSWVEDLLGEAGIPIKGGRILLLCMPRLLGHVFNPLSIYYCHRRDGSLAAMLYEVNNTFGQRHCYLIEARPGEDGEIRQSCDKAFYVSPFMDMAMRYEFVLTLPKDRVRTCVLVRNPAGEPVIVANFTGARRDLTDLALLFTAIQYPLVTLKVVAAIRVEAVKLWLKGFRWRSPPPPPPEPVTIICASRP
jgi:hypothetical protein